MTSVHRQEAEEWSQRRALLSVSKGPKLSNVQELIGSKHMSRVHGSRISGESEKWGDDCMQRKSFTPSSLVLNPPWKPVSQ